MQKTVIFFLLYPDMLICNEVHLQSHSDHHVQVSTVCLAD